MSNIITYTFKDYRLLVTFIVTLSISLSAYSSDSIMKELDFNLVTELELGANLHNGETEKIQLQIEPEIKFKLNEEWRLNLLGRVRSDANGNIDSQKRSKAELREFYMETNLGDNFLTVGKQQIVWGKADGLKVLDVINPQDFREFILDDFDDSRTPLWSINVEIPASNSVIQLIWIPDNTYNTFAEVNSLYAFTSALIVPTVPAGVSVDVLPTDKPNRFFVDSDVAVRLSSFVAGWDVTANYLYHYNDTPVLFRSLSLVPVPTITVTPRYERSHLFGSTFSNAFDSIVLRGEIGYSSDQYFLSNNTNSTTGVIKSDELAYVVGLDWTGLEDTFLSVQIFQSRLIDTQPGLVRDKIDTTASFLARRNFSNDTVTTEVLWLHNSNNQDGLLRPKLRYDWQDDIKLWIRADLFYGNKNGLFGQFDQNDRLIAGIEWSR